MELSQYWQEFTVIVVVHLLAVASPGPDFAIIVKQSLGRSRKHAIYTSLGIGTGIVLHVCYSILGIGLLIKNSPLLYQGLIYIAAAYLAYIGVLGLKAKPQTLQQQDLNVKEQGIGKAFITGFLVNGLNVKATLFFVSLFSMVIATTTPLSVQIFYGSYLAIATAIWFMLLSILLTTSHIQQHLVKQSHWVDRIMGVVLISLAISILW